MAIVELPNGDELEVPDNFTPEQIRIAADRVLKPTRAANVSGDQWKENLKTEGSAFERGIASAGAAMNDQFRNVKRIFAGDDTKGINGQSGEEIQALSGLNMPANIAGHVATAMLPGAAITRGTQALGAGRGVAQVLANAGLAAATSKDRLEAAGMSGAIDMLTRGGSRAVRGMFTPTAAAREATEAGLPLTLGQQVRGNGVVGNAINAVEEGAMVANPARQRARQAGTDAIYARTIGRRGTPNPGMGASTSPLEELAALKQATGTEYDAAFANPIPTDKVRGAIDAATNSIPLPGVRREYATEMARDMTSQLPRKALPPAAPRPLAQLFSAPPEAPFAPETDGDTVRRLIQNFREKGQQLSMNPQAGNRLEKIAASRRGRAELMDTLPNADEVRDIQRQFAEIARWEDAGKRAANAKQGGTITPGKLLEAYRGKHVPPAEQRFVQSMTNATADVLPDSGTAIRSRVLNGGALLAASTAGGGVGSVYEDKEFGPLTYIGAAAPFVLAALGSRAGTARYLTGQTGVQKRLNAALQAAGNRSPLIRDSLQTMIATTPKHAIEGEEE